MTLDEAFRSAIREEVREAVRAELTHRPSTTNAKAFTRRQFASMVGIGRTKLQELIASGTIKTVEDNPRLIPMSEADRYTKPRRQKPRRRVRPVAPAGGTQNPEALREALRRGGR